MTKIFRAMMAEQRFSDAEKVARTYLGTAPDKRIALTLLARALLAQGRSSEALESAAQSVSPEPRDSSALICYATALESCGRVGDAMVVYRRCIEMNPEESFAYYALARNHGTAGPDLIKIMEALLADPALAPARRAYIEYSLGKVSEDAGGFEGAMKHYDEANRVLLQSIPPRPPGLVTESLAFRIKNLDAGFVQAGLKFGSPDETPIFVVGMMRSGTTLAEQILTCHPLVGTIGERRFWLDRRARVLDPPGNVVNPERMKQAIGEYMSIVRPLGEGKARVVERTPINYAHLAIIYIAFPNARIIHMNRHPVDTCLSIWTTPDAAPAAWGHDKAAIVEEYRAYMRIMEHWRSILPAERLMDVRYEELVANQEQVTRRMIEFCGLDWDDACLTPERNERSVSTPSVWQVRQPVYRTSLARWQKFEPWLGELADLLGQS